MLATARHCFCSPGAARLADDVCWRPDIGASAVCTNLSSSVTTPTVHGTTLCNGKTVVCATCYRNDRIISVREGYQHRVRDVPARILGDECATVVRKAKLPVLVVAACIDAAVRSEEERVLRAASDLHDRCRAPELVFTQTLDAQRRGDDAAIALVRLDTCSGLPVAVEAPSPHGAFCVDGEGVICSDAHGHCSARARLQDHAFRNGALDHVALEDPAAELHVFARAGAIDLAVGGKEEEVIVAGCDGGKFQAGGCWYRDWFVLFEDVGGEPKLSVGCLRQCVRRSGRAVDRVLLRETHSVRSPCSYMAVNVKHSADAVTDSDFDGSEPFVDKTLDGDGDMEGVGSRFIDFNRGVSFSYRDCSSTKFGIVVRAACPDLERSS